MCAWFRLGIVVVGVLCSTAAYADTIYNVTLTPSTNNGVSGNGTFSLNVAPSAVGKTTYTVGGKVDALDAFSISIGGDTFDLSVTSSPTSVVFNGGKLSSITYGASIGSTALQLTSLNYGFITIGYGAPATIGTITAAPVVTAAVTPEPSGIALLGTGLLTCVFARFLLAKHLRLRLRSV